MTHRRMIVGGYLLLLAASGCLVDNPGSIRIIGLRKAEPGGGSETDDFDCTVAEEYVAGGTVDVLLEQWGYLYSYHGHIEILNSLASGNSERDFLTLQRINVDLVYPYSPDDPVFNAAIANLINSNCCYSVPVAGTLDASGSMVLKNVPLIPSELLLAIAQELGSRDDVAFTDFVIETRLKVIAERATNEVESSEFPFSVRVFKGQGTWGVIQDLDCSDAREFPLMSGDPCSGMPIDRGVTCCFESVEVGDATERVLVCPHPQATGGEET